MPRREIFAGNWKMYKTSQEARELVKGLLDGMPDIKGREVVVFPPSPWALSVAEQCRGTKISVGMQNMYFEQEGAFTGEVSPLMVKDAGCRYILIGHSERRHVFGENGRRCQPESESRVRKRPGADDMRRRTAG